MEVFLELEHKDLINETNLELLETTIQSICPVLIAKINQYKVLQGKLLNTLIANVT